ncbi:MAG: hypothetical protein D6765_06880 [Bacteroidetes bacterium]|nr:MAG: hypothetical protein D6765_06880 [Bacteroidota bacterium]
MFFFAQRLRETANLQIVITYEQIEQIAESLSREGWREDFLQEMADSQPALVELLFSESLEMLTPEERNYLLFLAAVLWQTAQTLRPLRQTLDRSFLEEVEDRNWALLNASAERKFTDRVAVFFENYPEEDLLAFVEDALFPAEDPEREEFITREGREPMFVVLKTLIDALFVEE